MRNGAVVRLVHKNWVFVLPSDAVNLRNLILRELHATALGGHLGRKKLEGLVRKRVWWTTLDRDLRQFCKECVVC